MKLSGEQQRLFWRTFKRACEVHCVPKGSAQTAYRQGMIEQATGLRSLTQVKPGTQFDQLMVIVARAAGETALVDHFSEGRAKRSALMAEQNIRQLLELKGTINPSQYEIHAYMAGMLRQHRGSLTVSVPNVEHWWASMEQEDLDFLLKSSYIALKRRQKNGAK